MNTIIDYGQGIAAIDSGFTRPLLAAVYCIVEDGRVALVDTAASPNAPTVLAALAARGLAPAQVDWILLTHIHLDHAGAAGTLMRALPNAKLAVHPRGARHMADPSRLLAGTVAVYGEAATREKYGELLPIEAWRIVAVADDAVLKLGARSLRALDTPGHAPHHACYLDEASGHVFAGDAFGLSYRELDRGGRAFALPVTSPSQFDPEAMHRSLQRLEALQPEAVYVAHFGQLRDIPRLAGDLHRLIDSFVAATRAVVGGAAQRQQNLCAALGKLLEEEGRRQGWGLAGDALRQLLASDIDLNAQGLLGWLEHQA